MAKKPSKAVKHKSFRRSYREDYQRETITPGIMGHILETFKIILKNWKLFLPLLIIAVILNIVLVGVMNEANYTQLQSVVKQTSLKTSGEDVGGIAKAGALLILTIINGGVLGGSSQMTAVFSGLIFLVIWLTTIFFLRQRLAGHEVKVRDGLYNAMTPMLSVLVVFLVVIAECIPIFLLIIAYAAAVQTGFLTMPFYALMFFVFAVLMLTLAFYLLSSSLMALVAVSAPGLYPMEALRAAADLILHRRMKFIIRIIALIVMVILMWVVVMLPIIGFDLWMKTFAWTEGIPFVPVCFIIMTCFSYIYVTTYFYLYYRWLLDA